jgi:hypothetical protein
MFSDETASFIKTSAEQLSLAILEAIAFNKRQIPAALLSVLNGIFKFGPDLKRRFESPPGI